MERCDDSWWWEGHALGKVREGTHPFKKMMKENGGVDEGGWRDENEWKYWLFEQSNGGWCE